ncbi:MAG: glycosyltransferase family 2 protein [Chloroflexota bacterium]
MDKLPTVTTVVLNWNGLADTRECLQSLRSTDYPANRIVLVDNGSREDEASVLASEFGDFLEVIRLPENEGFAGGMNAGIRRALELGTDYVLLLNNDTIVDPSFLRGLVDGVSDLKDLAAANPKAYFYGRPRTIYSTGGAVSLWRGVARQIGRGQIDTGQFDKRARREYADGMCLLIPTAAIRKVGLLDEEYFAYWEETDWCLRARDMGLRCYFIPNSRIWHKAERSQAPSAKFHYLYRRNALLFVRKRGTGLQVATTIAAQALFYAPLYFLRHPTKIARVAAEFRALVWHSRNRPKERPLV